VQDSVLRSKVPELVLARLAPRDPTDAMLTTAHDWSAAKYGRPIGNDAAIGCWRAMHGAAAPAAADNQATDRLFAKVRKLVRQCGGDPDCAQLTVGSEQSNGSVDLIVTYPRHGMAAWGGFETVCFRAIGPPVRAGLPRCRNHLRNTAREKQRGRQVAVVHEEALTAGTGEGIGSH
jgi:hypothetical protein